MSSAPVVFPFYGEGASQLFTIYHGMTQACCDHSMHDPHVTHSMRVVGKHNCPKDRGGSLLPRPPAHCFGPGQTTPCAYVCPRPGGSCRCTKVWVLLYPLLVHERSQPPLQQGLARQRKIVEGKTGTKNIKTAAQSSKQQEASRGTPSNKPCQGNLRGPRQAPCRGSL